MTNRVILTAIDCDPGTVARDLAAVGWDVAGRVAPDVAAVAWVLLADDAGRLLAPLAQAGGMGMPVLCLTTADAAMEGRLLRAGAHMVLPGDVGGEGAAGALTALVRLADPAGRVVRVGDLRLCPATRQGWRAGRLLPLRPLDFDLLLALAARAGRVVPAADLAACLWPSAPDAAERLAVHVHTLRRALGPGAPLRTVGRRGYLLTGGSL